MIKHWPVVQSRVLGKFRLFDIHGETKTSPRNERAHEFIVMKCPNWVNVVAVTPAQELVMVEQFRHGTQTVELEIPGGMIDPTDASPVAAGLRELREETGFAGTHARLLGDIYPNPAIMENTCYTVLVEQCTKQHELQWDPCEDILTRLVPVAEVPTLVAQGKIKHSLVVVALYYYELYQRGIKPV